MRMMTKVIGDWLDKEVNKALDRIDEPAQCAKAIGLGLLEGVFLGCATLGAIETVANVCKLITKHKK